VKEFATLLMQKPKSEVWPGEVRLHICGLLIKLGTKKASLLNNNGDPSQLISSSPSPERLDEMD
jgi:hypothetical protein